MPGRAMDPIRVPASLWQRPEMLDALRRRDIGRALRLVQQFTGASRDHSSADVAGVAGACFEVLAASDKAKATHHLAESERRIHEALRLRHELYVRSRVLDLIGLANVHLAQDQAEQACQDARTAASLATRLRSPRVTRRIHTFAAGALELHPDREELWALADHVRTQLPVVSH